MAPAGFELLIAARADAVVPALVIALGGTLVETLDDVAVVPLPADRDRCKAAMLSLRGAPALTGARGAGAVDVDAAAALAAGVGSLLLDSGLDLLELNPVVVHRKGCVAVDAIGRRPAD
jgi:hypothetical protein